MMYPDKDKDEKVPLQEKLFSLSNFFFPSDRTSVLSQSTGSQHVEIKERKEKTFGKSDESHDSSAQKIHNHNMLNFSCSFEGFQISKVHKNPN